MWHTIFITVHAAAGACALLSGTLAIRGGRLFRTYLTCLVLMTAALGLAIGAGWPGLATGARVLFCALLALGVIMVGFALRARSIAPRGTAPPRAAYVEHVGFTLVALFDAFVVVGMLDLGAPTWSLIAAGVVIGTAGHFAIRAARTRLAGRTHDSRGSQREYPFAQEPSTDRPSRRTAVTPPRKPL